MHTSTSNTRRSRLGFTLVELLVVIGIIALLIGILLPTLSRARESARGIACSSNQRQIAIALLGYANDFDGSLPVGFRRNDPVGTGTLEYQMWVHAVSGYMNSDRINGYTLPWTFEAVIQTDPDDNYHPAVYCPSVEAQFADLWTHYGINNVMMPDYHWDTSVGGFAGTPVEDSSLKPFRLVNAYADNFLTHDKYSLDFAGSTTKRNTGLYLVPSVAMNGIDFANTIFDRLDDAIMYRNETGFDPYAGAADLELAQPAMIPGPDYEASSASFKFNSDVIVSGNSFSTLLTGPIFRHGASDTCNMSFVDGSVRGMKLNLNRVHEGDSRFLVSEIERTHIRPKTPNPLPRAAGSN